MLAPLDLTRPVVAPGAEHVYHRSNCRNALPTYLREYEIGTLIHYPIPIHQQPAYAERCRMQYFPACEQTAGEILSLPMYPQLTEEDIHTVVDHIVQLTYSSNHIY
jgi:dTDP-4-amino-4,6-dideoxygalactose transaminase